MSMDLRANSMSPRVLRLPDQNNTPTQPRDHLPPTNIVGEHTSNPSAIIDIPLLLSSTAYPKPFYKIKADFFGILFLF